VELLTRCEKRKRVQCGLRISGTDFGFPGGTTYTHNYCNAVVYPNAVCTLGFILFGVWLNCCPETLNARARIKLGRFCEL
jgi:hypothetical protein